MSTSEQKLDAETAGSLGQQKNGQPDSQLSSSQISEAKKILCPQSQKLNDFIILVDQVLEEGQPWQDEVKKVMLKDLPEIIIKSMGTTFSSVPEFNKPEFCLVLKEAMARLAKVLVLEYADADLLENLKIVFDPKTRIYTQHLLQEENTILLSNSVSMHSQEEREWRLTNLIVGTKVDALKIDSDRQVRAWAQGKIVERNEKAKTLTIHFENESKLCDRVLSIWSPDIEKADSRQDIKDDLLFRDNLKPGDIVSVNDTTGPWYESTILQMENEREYKNEKIKMVKIAFRVNHPMGDKKDSDGNKYFGWEPSFDEWIPLYSAKIRPSILKIVDNDITGLESQTQLAQNANGVTKSPVDVFKPKVDDSFDSLVNNFENGGRIFAVHRKECRSDLLISFLNELGSLGFFEKVEQRMEQADQNANELILISKYLNMFGKISSLLHRQIVLQIFPKLEGIVKNKFLQGTSQQLRNLQKQTTDDVINSLYKEILVRLNGSLQNDESPAVLLCKSELFQVELAMHYLSQNFLERRIQGVKLLHEICFNCLKVLKGDNSNKQNKIKLDNVQQVLDIVMKNNNLLSELFSKDRTHVQLVQRTEQIIRLLMAKKMLQDQDRIKIWACASINQGEMKNEVLKVLEGAAVDMHPDDRKFFISQVLQIETSQIEERELKLVSEICATIVDRDSHADIIELGLEFLWKTVSCSQKDQIQQKQSNSSKIAQNAGEGLVDILKNQKVSLRIRFLERIIKTLGGIEQQQCDWDANYQIIQVIHNLFNYMNTKPFVNTQSSQGPKNLNELIEILEEKYELLQTVILELQKYSEQANKAVNSSITDPEKKQLLKGQVIHQEHILARLQFIQCYSQIHPEIKLTQPRLQILWQSLVVNSKIDHDKKLLFNIIKDICDQAQKKLSDKINTQENKSTVGDLIIFFTNIMQEEGEENSQKIYSDLSIEGFQCIQSLFILSNSLSGKLIRIDDNSGLYKANKTADSSNQVNSQTIKGTEIQTQTQKFTSYSNVNGPSYVDYEFNQKTGSSSSANKTNYLPGGYGATVYGPTPNPSFTQTASIDQKEEKDQEPDSIPLEILVAPTELDGYEMLWRVATESTGKQVIDTACKLLIQLHHDVPSTMIERIPEFDDLFIDKCFKIIQLQLPQIQKRAKHEQDEIRSRIEKMPISSSTIQILKALPLQERRIARSLFMLRQLIRASEKGGTLNLNPHQSLGRGVILDKIQIQNNVITGQGTRQRFELKISNNATLWDLKKLIGVEIVKTSKDNGTTYDLYPSGEQNALPKPIHPAAIRLFQMALTRDIKDPNNGQTLGDLNFKPNETLGVFRKSTFQTRRQQIVHDNQITGQPELTEAGKACCTQIFQNFAQQKNEFTGEPVMDQKDCIKYTTDCTGQISNLEDSRVQSFMKLYSNLKEFSSQSFVDQQSYFQFCIDACVQGREDKLRENFKKLGYSQDLKHFPKDGEDDDIMQVRSKKELMPRYKMSSNEQYFEILMSLLSMDKEVSSKASELINCLITQPNLLTTVKKLESNKDSIVWNQLFDQSNVYRTLYSLEIIEALLISDGKEKTDSEQQNQSWLQRFIENGGLEELQKQLASALETMQKEETSSQKKLVDQLLKLIRLLVISAFDCNNEEQKILEDTPQKEINNEQVITENYLFSKEEKREVDQSLKVAEITNLESTIKNGNLQKQILERIDWQLLEQQVLSVVNLFIQNSDDLKKEDRLIVDNCLALWAQLLLKKEHNAPICNQNFLLKGLLISSDIKIRESFFNNFENIAKKKQSFHQEILNMLISSLPNADLEVKNKGYRTKEYYQLINKLVAQMEAGFEPQIDHLLSKVIIKIKTHQSNEKYGSVLIDTTLSGLIDCINTIITKVKDVKDKELLKVHSIKVTSIFEEHDFTKFLFKNCLFGWWVDENGSERLTMCQSNDSRKSAFNILTNYQSILEPVQMIQFLELYIKPLLQQVQRPKGWKHKPSNKGRHFDHCGIQNLGCICYMISMLQQFFMVPQFRYQLLKAESGGELPDDQKNYVEYKDEMIDDDLLRQLQRLFGYLELSQKQAFNPKAFCFAFKDFDGQPTRIGEQKDSQEFLNFFMDRIENLLKPTSQQFLIRDVFQGSQCSQMICGSCGMVRNRLEIFNNLSLQVKGSQDIHESLAKLIKGQVIEDYTCDGCKQKVNLTKRALLADMPNTLVVHLQRIEFSFDTLQNDKVNNYFQFPTVLDLKAYSYKQNNQEEIQQTNIENAQDEEKVDHEALLQIEDDAYIYRLVGVNIHRGTADHGHYWSLIDIKRGSDEIDPNSNSNKGNSKFDQWAKVDQDPWRTFNDSEVTNFDFSKNIKQEAFGTESSDQKKNNNKSSDAMTDAELSQFLESGSQSYGQSAYMLIYERKSKKSLHEVKDGQTNLIDFRSVEKFVPDWIRKEVVNDNLLFTVDSNLYHEHSFGLLKAILKNISERMLYSSNYDQYNNFLILKQHAIDVGGKVLFDMLAHFDQNTQIRDFSENLDTILTFCDSAYFLVRGEKSLAAQFVNKYFLDDNGQHLFQILFTCSDLTSRKYAAQIAAKAIIRLFTLIGDCEQEILQTNEHAQEVYKAAIQFIDLTLLQLSDKECQRNSAKLDGYFNMIKTIAQSSLTASQYLLEKGDIISDLIDFILGNQSPRAIKAGEKRISMNGVIPPPFQPFYTLISHFIRMTHTQQMDLTIRLPSHQTQPVELRKFEAQKTYFLTDEAQSMLFATEFLEKVIQDVKYDENKDFAQVVCHLAYNNLDFSERLIVLVLKAISYCNSDQIQRLLNIIEALSQVKDQWQRHRLEYLFGYPFLMHVKEVNQEQHSEELDYPTLQYGAKALMIQKNEELYQLQSSIDARWYDASLLKCLQKYKNQLDSFTLTCLSSLCSLLVSDNEVANYFADIPGYNFSSIRYTDWIRPYLEKKLQELYKLGEGLTGVKEKEEQILKVLSTFERYEDFLKSPLLQQKPPVYQIIQAVKEKQIQKQEIDSDLTMVITQVACEWSFLETLNQQPNQDLITNQQQNEVYYCEDLLYRITIINNSAQTKGMRIEFIPAENQDNLDIEYPRGGIVADFIKSKCTSHIITLRRINPTKGALLNNNEQQIGVAINKLEIKVSAYSYDKADFNMSSYSSESDKPSVGNQVKKDAKKDEGKNQSKEEEIEFEDVKEKKVEFQTQTEEGYKECPVCTFHNPEIYTFCEVCQTSI